MYGIYLELHAVVKLQGGHLIEFQVKVDFRVRICENKEVDFFILYKYIKL